MRPKIVPTGNILIGLKASEKGFRLNGQYLCHFNGIEICFGKSNGSCEILFENGTRVFTQVSCSIGEPNDSRPGEGLLTISTWISPTATAEMSGGGPASKKPAIIARILEKIFKENRVLDMENLCIKFGEKVWIVRADVHILDTNGCLAEAAAFSMLGALLTSKRPDARIDPSTDKLIVPSIDDCIPLRLHLNHFPSLTSFSITPNAKLIVEPDAQEEEIFTGKFLIGLNESKELCFLQVTNPITYDLLNLALKLAQENSLERIQLLRERLAKYEEAKNIPVYMNLEKSNTDEAKKVHLEGKTILLSSISDKNSNSSPFEESSVKHSSTFPEKRKCNTIHPNAIKILEPRK